VPVGGLAGAVEIGRKQPVRRRQAVHQGPPLGRAAGVGVQADDTGTAASFTEVRDRGRYDNEGGAVGALCADGAIAETTTNSAGTR
jgi:hypothetical protein